MSNKFYITTTLPYVNAEPHIGFALEVVQADVIACYRRQQGDDVFFNTGTDEHGLKVYRLNVADLLQPFIPAVAERIVKQFGQEEIKRGESLFPRI